MRQLKYLFVLALLLPALAVAQTILPGSRGGTGYATTTGGNVGNCLSVSTASPLTWTFSGCAGGSGGGSTFGTTSLSALLPLIWNTSTAQLSTLFTTTTDTGIGHNLFIYTDNSGVLKGAASSSLSLPNAALQNSSFTLNGTGISLGDTKTITAASSTLLGDTNTFGGTNKFTNITITNATTGSLYITQEPSTVLTTDSSGQVVATTSIGIHYGGTNNTSFTPNTVVVVNGQADRLITLANGTNGQVLSLSGGIPTWLSSTTASTTLLSDTNTFSGTDKFSNPITDGSLAGLIAGNSGLTYAVSTTSMNASITGSAGSVANAVTFNSSGGAAANTSFNGSSAVTVDYHTVGAQIAGSYDSFGWPFVTATNFSTTTFSTTTPLWAKFGVFASSTSRLDQINVGSTTANNNGGMATSTFYGNIDVKGYIQDDTITNSLVFDGAGGTLGAYGGSNCSAGQAPTGINGAGTVQNCTTYTQNGVTSVTATAPIFASSGATPNITWQGFSTTTPWAANQIVYTNNVGLGVSVATGTVSAGSTAITVTANRFVIGGALAIDCATASGSQNGCLSSGDWTTFNGKDGFGWPFKALTDYATTTAATTTPIWAQFGIFASSTSHFTAIDVTGATSTGTLFVIGSTTVGTFNAPGLISCNSATNALTWSAGTFGCNTISGGNGAPYAWTPATFGGLTTAATTSVLYPYALVGGTSTIGSLVASSSLTAKTITNFGVTSALVLNGSGGLEGAYAGSNPCTAGQAALSISATGVISCTNVSTLTYPFTPTTLGSGSTQTSATTTVIFDIAGFFSATSTIGQLNATTSLRVGNGTLQSGAMFEVASSSPMALQNVLRNTATGPTAATSSADLIFENASSTNTTYYGDVGFNSAQNADLLYTIVGPHDLYAYSSDGSVAIGTASTTNGGATLKFFTAGTLAAQERARIDSGGRFGIGTTTPRFQLDVASTSPQFCAGDAVISDSHWCFFNKAGVLFLATTSPTTFATSTLSSFQIDRNGKIAALDVPTGYTGVITPLRTLTLCEYGSCS